MSTLSSQLLKRATRIPTSTFFPSSIDAKRADLVRKIHIFAILILGERSSQDALMLGTGTSLRKMKDRTYKSLILVILHFQMRITVH